VRSATSGSTQAAVGFLTGSARTRGAMPNVRDEAAQVPSPSTVAQNRSVPAW
jgi:hypothetical protein